MNEKNEFKPYIPADKVTPEITVTSVIMGILLAVVFGAANAYLGLRVGMTVSASIPAAVIAMGVIRVMCLWYCTVVPRFINILFTSLCAITHKEVQYNRTLTIMYMFHCE